MKVKSLEDLFLFEMRDVYHAEKQLVKALPKLAKAASDPQLRSAVEEHLEQTRGHVERLERVFRLMDQKAKTQTCQAMEGLVEEGKAVIDTKAEPTVLDAGLIAAAQKVEHYEIACYGTLVAWAQQLGRSDAADLLHQTLDEEKADDEKLTSLAESMVNAHAEHAGAVT
jgi:ferritin-like metal-binding protein YciE